MRVGVVGLQVMLLGSVFVGTTLGATEARAAHSHEHAAVHAGAGQSSVRVAAASHAGEGGEHGSTAHRGGGLKSTHGGGPKSAFAEVAPHSGHAVVQKAMFGSERFGSFAPGGRFGHYGKNAKARMFAGVYSGRYSGGYGVVQCVTFAREDTGIALSGNAANWWDNAAGRYARGSEPEPGAVLNFRATGRMRLGHVSVVSRVVGAREIEIDHAHWGGPGSNGGGVARGVTVVDVSPSNDWSEVRVGLGGPGEFGSSYPTYGFIYNRPDRGLSVADSRSQRYAQPAEEVAAAPARVRSVSASRNDGAIYDRNSQ